jgi:integrase
MAAPLIKTKTPGVYRRGSRYVAVWEHRGRQHKEAFATYAEAREAKNKRQSGDRRPTSRVSFTDYFAEWIESYAGRTARGFSETTRPEYRRPIENLALPEWGTWRLAEVESTDVRALFGELRRSGASTSKIKKLRAALSAMFATAVEDGVVRSNPVTGVRIPAAPADESGEDRAKALTRAELSILLAALPGDWRLFFEFLAHTGLRISEAIGLNWQYLDLGESPKVRVREQIYRGKRKRLKSANGRRDVPLSPGMAARLLAHRRDTYGGEDRPVFASATGTVLNSSNIARRDLKPAARSVGLGWVSAHTFRHTCASLLFEAGRNVKQVQEWLGHADPGFTLSTYVHLMDAGVGDAAFLDDATGEGVARGWQPNTREQPQTSPGGSNGKAPISGQNTEQPQGAAGTRSDS